MKKYNVVVVGVGAVGIRMLRILRQRKFPIETLKVLARSSREIEVDGEPYSVRAIAPEEFEGIDIALFAGTEGEKGAAVIYAKEAIERGAVVVDNGADFRLDPKVPLVIPEVNPEDLKLHKGLIASPNCSTIQLVVALAPIHRVSRIRRIIVSTYQSASGAGRGAIDELREQSEAFVGGRKIPQPQVLPKQVAFNVFPQVGRFEELDYTAEEWKTVRETHKILHDANVQITATTVRVPVFNAHSESVYIETKRGLSVDEVRDILRKAPGVTLVDDPDPNAPPEDPNRRIYPIPVDADGTDDVFVGRIRQDPFIKNGLSLWVVSDNLRKGAALNTIQIAELLD